MHPRDYLHLAAVAISQAAPVDRLHPADVRITISSERDLNIGGQAARHTRRPQQLVAEMSVGKLVNVTDAAQRFPGGCKSRCNKFEERFREIRGDISICQCRPERGGMRRLRQKAVGTDAQGFFLYTL